MKREANTLASLDHPNVIQMVGAVRDSYGDLTMIVMELASCTLKDWCIRRQSHCAASRIATTTAGSGSEAGVPLGLLLRLFTGAARGLNYLHAQSPPVFHRDLKDDNIFLLLGEDDKVESIKVGDLGEAKVRGGGRLGVLVVSKYFLPSFKSLMSYLFYRGRPHSPATSTRPESGTCLPRRRRPSREC